MVQVACKFDRACAVARGFNHTDDASRRPQHRFVKMEVVVESIKVYPQFGLIDEIVDIYDRVVSHSLID